MLPSYFDVRSQDLASELRSLSESSSGFSEATLDLLQRVERTVDTLGNLQKVVRHFLGTARRLRGDMAEFPRDSWIEPEEDLIGVLEAAEDAIRRMIGRDRLRRASAIRDPDLNGDHEEAVVAEYDRFLALQAELAEALQAIRWDLMEHNADLEKPMGPPTSDPNEIAARLRDQ
jgi:uncharacterized protein YukE